MRPALFAFLSLCLFLSGLAHADEDLAPQQRLSNIEQRYANGERRLAQREVKAWAESDEKGPWPLLAEATIQFHQKKYKKCLSLAGKALERDPQNAEGYYWRGRCYEAKGNPLEAANEYRAALKAEAAHPQAHEGLSRIQTNLGGADAAPTAN